MMNSKIRPFARLFLIVLMVVLPACSLVGSPAVIPTATPVPVAPSATAVAPSPSATAAPVATPQVVASPTATRTAAAPSPTQAQPTAAPTAVPSPTATAVPPAPSPVATATPASAASPTPADMSVRIYLIAIGDGGRSGAKIGCEDSLVPVDVRVPYTQGVLRAALEKLFSIRERMYGASGLYNSLYQSQLRIDSAVVSAGKATVRLSGYFSMGGECDSPRVQAQIEQTALQFSTVQTVTVLLNERPLADVLSLK